MHTPDIQRIPESIRSLEWQRMDDSLEREWSDGQRLLVAVPVCSGPDREKWAYELSVVRIECDEHYFRVTLAGEPWGWDLDDADYYVEIR